MNNLDNNKNRRVIVIDDNRAIHDDFRKILAPDNRGDLAMDASEAELFGSPKSINLQARYQLDSAYQGEEGLLQVQKANEEGRPYAMAFVDVRMPPGMDGVETTQKIWEIDPEIQIVLCTAYSDASWDEMLGEIGNNDRMVILKKPFDAVEAFQLAQALTEKWWLSRQAQRKMENLEELVAERTQKLNLRNIILSTQQEAAYDGILVVDENVKILSINRRFVELWGVPTDLIGNQDNKPLLQFIADRLADPSAFLKHVQYLCAHRRETSQEEIELKDGRIFDRFSAPMFGEDNKYYGRVWYFRDITERKQAEEAQLESLLLLERIINTIPVRVFWKDMNLNYLGCNKALARDAGFAYPAEIVGKNDKQMGWRDQAEHYNAEDRRVIAGESILNKEDSLTTPGGKRLTLLTNKVLLRNSHGEIFGVLGAYTDITEQRNLEEQCRQAQKMDAVGHLAGGVAHDFNNMLQIILGYTEIAINTVGPDSPIAEELQIILNAGLNSSSLTKQLLTFARKEIISPKVMDLNHVISDMLKMLQRLIGEQIELTWNPGASLPPVRLDPSQVNQIVANLCINARDAINGNGKINLETKPIVIDAAYCALHPEAEPGEYVCLTVSDDGCGMDQETLIRIFEPFFTTKAHGKGTGLGLATVYGIVKQNNGFIQAKSEPKHGTVFKIYLPQVTLENSSLPIEKEDEVTRGRGETILLVEDETELCILCNKFLCNIGYTVIAAKTPNEALSLFSKHQKSIKLLLTDVIMPEMNGRQLAERIHQTQPDIKVLYMSGYAQGVMTDQSVLKKNAKRINKPFKLAKLAWEIRDVLDNKPDA